MKVEINLKAQVGDEVWLALDGGQYKANVAHVETRINHDANTGHILYFVRQDNKREESVHHIAIFHTKEEAQQRIDRYKGIKPYSIEFARELHDEVMENPEVVIVEK